jgi:4-amino-4-deoxy-L-arabinose transferase-like glycosyltransferase
MSYKFNTTTEAMSRPLRWQSGILIVLLGCALLGVGTWQLPLLDRDEPRFAQATVEMLDRGNLMIPYFNGAYRFDKPPLTYWGMMAGYSLFGVTEFGARFHSIAATLIVALCLWGMATKMNGNRSGVAVAFAWLTSLQVMIHGRVAVADMLLILFVVTAQWALMELLGLGGCPPNKMRIWWWLLYLSLAFGFLAKGPLAILLPVVSLLLYRWLLWKKPIKWSSLQLHWGLLLVMGIIGLWGIPALMMTKGAYWETGIGYHVVQRGMGAFNKRLQIPFIYYFLTSLFSLYPWIFLLLWKMRHLGCRWNTRTAYLVAWGCSSYLVFSFYATQLPHYVLPSLPAWLLLLFDSELSSQQMKFAKQGLTVTLTLLVVLLLITMGIYFGSARSSISLMLSAGLVILIGLGGMSLAFLKANKEMLIICFLLLLVALSAVGFIGQRDGLVRQIGRFVSDAPKDKKLYGLQFHEPGLVFYANHSWEFDSDEIPLSELLKSEDTWAVITELEERSIEDVLLNRQCLKTDASARDLVPPSKDYTYCRFQGLNFSKFSWVVVGVLKKTFPNS